MDNNAEDREHLRSEPIVVVQGTVHRPGVGEPTESTSIHNLEIHITHLHLIASPGRDKLSKNPKDIIHHTSNRTHRIIDIQPPVTQSISRIQSTIASVFRSYLDTQGFIEIHTPKLQTSATESGSSVFPVKYFGRKAFLAQSPKLGKQMSISGDLGRVYEVGPVFRAENFNTHRHMTEFTGLDLEMTLEEH